MELYLKKAGTCAQRLIVVAGRHEIFQTLVLEAVALQVVVGMPLGVDSQSLLKRPNQAQLFDEVDAMHDPIVQLFHHRLLSLFAIRYSLLAIDYCG